MLVTKQKKQLPLRLLQLSLKLNSIFFKRLILFQENADQSGSVRHYDLECEGIQVLVAIIKKKQQGILMKAISDLKNFRNMNYSKVAVTQSKNPTGTTKRTNLNTTYAMSDISPIKYVQGNMKSYQRQSKDYQYTINSNVKVHSNLNHLLEKVKLVNIRNIADAISNNPVPGTQINNIRETASFCIGKAYKSRFQPDDRYFGQAPSEINYRVINNPKQYKSQSQFTTLKKSRRQSIINKLKIMEENIEILFNDDPFGVKDTFWKINNIKQSITANLQKRRYRQYIH